MKINNSKGKIYIAGIGPGELDLIPAKAISAIQQSDAIVGYKTYINLITDLIQDKEVISNGMLKERERCLQTLQLAETGKMVTLVSSGDPGVYGMAGLMLEIIENNQSQIELEIIPGITSVTAAAALLGAPLMHDFAVISLSDLLTDWNLIQKRLEHTCLADFIICLYNPKSKKRIKHIEIAREICLQHKPASTPVGIVRNAYRNDQQIRISTLENFHTFPIDMLSIVLIGNSQTYIKNNRIITPRGYNI